MTQKISISLDESIIKIIDAERGDVPRSKYIENALKATGSFFEALWISSDEFENVTGMERWLSAHASQPVGKPLHKHEGYLSIAENTLRFYDKEMSLMFSIDRGAIRNLAVTYDETFRRFRDSRGLIPPLRIALDGKDIYLFTKTVGKSRSKLGWMFKGSNEALEMWYKNQ